MGEMVVDFLLKRLKAIFGGGPDSGRMIKQSFREKVEELLPGR